MTEIETRAEQILPAGWAWTTIGEIIQPITRMNPKDEPGQRFAYLDISSIDNNANRITKPKVIYGASAPSRARQVVEDGDVLFATVRPYLKNIAIVPGRFDKSIASTGFAVLRGEHGVLSEYLFYFCLTDGFITKLGKLQRGTSYPAVRGSDVQRQHIPLAPTAEQSRIVDEIEKQFTRLNAAVSALQNIQLKLRRARAAVLKSACEGELVPQDSNDEPASVLLQRILDERRRKWEQDQWAKKIEQAKQRAAKDARKADGNSLRRGEKLTDNEWQGLPEAVYGKYLPKDDSWKQKYQEPSPPNVQELPELPTGWIWATVEQLAAHEPRSITDGPFGSKLKTSHYTDSGPRVIRLQNIGDGDFIDEKAHISKQHLQSLHRHQIFEGDLVIAGLGNRIPRACIIPSFVGPAIVKADCIRFSPHPEAASTVYLNTVLNSEPLKRYTETIIHGVGRPRLNLPEIKALPIPLPPRSEQDLIVEKVEQWLSVILELNQVATAYLARTKRLRQVIFREAFSGKLSPQNPADEPATKLLERIQEERAKREQEEKIKKRTQRKRGARVKKEIQRRGLYKVLAEAAIPLSPNDLFAQAHFADDEIDEFYEELRKEVPARIEQIRPNEADVYLKAVKNET